MGGPMESEGEEAMRLAYEPEEYADAFRPAGFGLACTVAWTEICTALRADGIAVADRCGPKLRRWIIEMVEREFSRPACHHEPYQGACIHCGVPFHEGRPANWPAGDKGVCHHCGVPEA